MVSCMLSRTSSIAWRTSSRIVTYCAFRSTRGISCVAIAVMALWSPSNLDPLRQVLEPRVSVGIDADKTREVANVVLQLHRGIPGPHRSRRNRVTHDAPCPDERVLADFNPRQDRAVPADAGTPADDAALHAVEVRRTLGMRIVGEHHVRPEEDVVVDLRELEEATGVDAYARAEPVAGLLRRVRSDRDVVPDHVVLADRRALPGLKAGSDPRSGVDRGERPDDRARTDGGLELAALLATRRASQNRVLADDAPVAEPDVRRDDRRGMDRRLHAGAHER